MGDDKYPFKNPFQWFFQASLMVFASAIALTLAADMLTRLLPWLIGAGGIIGFVWVAVAVIRWRRSRW